MNKRSTVLFEVTPLEDNEVFYVADRSKKEFTYPIHSHAACELNFVEHASGVRRIVGDSSEIIGDYDLVLITSPNLEHVWDQHLCTSDSIREVTIQFNIRNSGENDFFSREAFRSINRMMHEARKGLCFPLETIMKVYTDIDTLSSIDDKFYAMLQLAKILYELSKCSNRRSLASTSYAKISVEDDSRRILKVKDFINRNYMDELRLPMLAEVANMSVSAFSRFFKLRTGRTLSEYITEVRLGYATRMLVNTSDSIVSISFNCGFNNLSNFNRVFRRNKGCTPSEFREIYNARHH